VDDGKSLKLGGADVGAMKKKYTGTNGPVSALKCLFTSTRFGSHSGSRAASIDLEKHQERETKMTCLLTCEAS
jgi:hypothetical protein